VSAAAAAPAAPGPAAGGRLRYPPQAKYIIGTEGCERFSFYGMRSILAVYMADVLAYERHEAEAWFHLFVMAAYLTPLVGGFLADRFLGRYRSILWISVGYVAGHATIALWETRTGLLVGLALVAAGAGGIKPSVSAFVGDQFDPREARLVQRMYGWFYWIVNVGSFGSTLLVPKLLEWYGPRVAFAVPGALMAIALVVFRGGRRHYVRAPPSGPDPHAFLRVVGRALRRAGTGRAGQHWLDLALDRHPPEAVEGAKAVFRIVGLFAAVTVFWALFDQHSSSWVLQAKQLDLAVGRFTLAPSQLGAMNPLLVMILIPLFTWVVFPALERRGVSVAPLSRIGAGMFLTVLSFVAAALVQAAIDGGHAPHALWQVVQYAFLTAGEVLVSVTALEFSYTQAPRAMKSTIMSIWFLTTAVGNLLTAAVSKLNTFRGAAYFWFFAALMLVASVAFRAVARRYRGAGTSPERGTAPGPA
jgi:POT family proton-dependent oligopeptide transporter